jgi:hypothetical protein
MRVLCYLGRGAGGKFWGVVAVGDERRAAQSRAGAEANACGEMVACIADRAGECEQAEMARRGGVDEPVDGLNCGHAGAEKDGRDDREPGASLGHSRAQRERDAQRERCQRIAEVVDHVGQQRDAAAREEHERLRERSEPEHGQRERHGPDALARALDALVNQPVGMTVSRVPVLVLRRVLDVCVSGGRDRLGKPRRRQVPVAAMVRMAMSAPTVAVRQ